MIIAACGTNQLRFHAQRSGAAMGRIATLLSNWMAPVSPARAGCRRMCAVALEVRRALPVHPLCRFAEAQARRCVGRVRKTHHYARIVAQSDLSIGVRRALREGGSGAVRGSAARMSAPALGELRAHTEAGYRLGAARWSHLRSDRIRQLGRGTLRKSTRGGMKTSEGLAAAPC